MALPIRSGINTTRKHFLKNQGFTLVEICVAMAIGAVLILSLAQYTLTSARTQKSQDLSNEFSQAMGTVGQALSNENICTSMFGINNAITIPAPLVSGSPVPSGLPVSLSIPVAGQSPLPVLKTGSLPSGLNIVSITAEAPTVMGPQSASGYTPEMLPITITAMKGPQPSPSPSNGTGSHTYFIGNNYFTKTFTIGVWVNGANVISKCTSSQDMAQQAPVLAPPVTYPSPTFSCTGAPPTCPIGASQSEAQCCTTQKTSPAPFWYCNSGGWSCPQS
jgi:prepilin-type N-terminal cleavage/methylation domain-containing protein